MQVLTAQSSIRYANQGDDDQQHALLYSSCDVQGQGWTIYHRGHKENLRHNLSRKQHG